MKLLLIGWDSADWKIINPLMDNGEMPNLEKLVTQGVAGNLATLYPELSPMLWTSIATGKRPYKHGILGFTEPLPSGDGVRPVTNISRKTRALWNIFTLNRMKSTIVGWWPSHPAEPINGVMVSNRYQRATHTLDKPWHIVPGTVYPERLTENLASLRLHPQELQTEHIAPFIQDLDSIDQSKDKRVFNIAKILTDCVNIHSATTALMQLEEWDFMAVYYDSIDHFSHGFMQYHPPKMPKTSQKDFDIYHDVVNSGYRFHDMMLGTLMELAGDDTVIMIISDHGFHSDHLRPSHIPVEPAGPAVQHRHYGIFVAAGPGIKKDERIYGAGLLDVAPTILSLFDLPVGEDMDGKPLVHICENPPKIKTIPSWDDVQGNAGTHPEDYTIDSRDAAESLQQLVALGYIEKPDENKEKAVKKAVRELDYNLAVSYCDAHLYYDALPILEKLCAEWPDEFRFGIWYVKALRTIGKPGEARIYFEKMIEHKKEVAKRAQKELKELHEELEKKPEEDISEEQHRKARKLRGQATVNAYTIEYLMGSLYAAENKYDDAVAHYEKACNAHACADIYIALGDVYWQQKKYEDAETQYKKAIEINPDNALAHTGLAYTYLSLRWHYDAVDEALTAIGLQFFNPNAHYVLGIALHRLGRIPRAIEALKVALVQNPNMLLACKRLAYIYEKRIKDSEKAAEYKKQAKEITVRLRQLRKGKRVYAPLEKKADSAFTSDIDVVTKDFYHPPLTVEEMPETITVVSGLPRSGTSMIMQMLAAGGIAPLTDNQREANEDNPKGYLEYMPVKNIRKDASWLPKAKGKTVKIIAQLLSTAIRYKTYAYRVIFVERDIEEILASQKKMLERTGGYSSPLSQEQLATVLTKQLQHIKRQLAVHRVPVVYISYKECIADPAVAVQKINEFMGKQLDEKAMARVVDPSLYRNKKK